MCLIHVSDIVWALPRLCLQRSSQSLSSVSSHVFLLHNLFLPSPHLDRGLPLRYFLFRSMFTAFFGILFSFCLKNCACAIILGCFSYFQGKLNLIKTSLMHLFSVLLHLNLLYMFRMQPHPSSGASICTYRWYKKVHVWWSVPGRV